MEHLKRSTEWSLMPLRFAYENIEYGGEIVNRIKKLHPEYFVLDQNMGGDYNSMVKILE